MNHKTRWLVGLLIVGFVMLAYMQTCPASLHAQQAAVLGQPISIAAMEAQLDQAGPIQLQTVVSADWQVDLSELLNLDSAAAKQAAITNHPEAIQVYFYLLRHPVHGVFLIDTGFSAQMVRDPRSVNMGWVLPHALHMDQVKFHQGPAEALGSALTSLRGVFLTHLHPDHVGGLVDAPSAVPVYIGPGEIEERHWTHFFTQPFADTLLRDHPPLQVWRFASSHTSGDNTNELAALDVFGDGSVFALHTPGHTLGSTAFLLRTTQGPVLLTGDVSHTRWGWDHEVEPGSATLNQPLNRASLLQLKALVTRHPQIQVHVGHQP